MKPSDEFYIGYLPRAPVGLSRRLRWVITLLLLLLLTTGWLLVGGQNEFSPAVYEFGKVRTFQGIMVENPYPMLAVPRPGQESLQQHYSFYLLTDAGKFGAADSVVGLDGKTVSVSGSLIFREGLTMIELHGQPVVSANAFLPKLPEEVVFGRVKLEGEIVDSKCFLGVMNPGNLKTHKACAIRCISGGVPPVLLVRQADGSAHYVLISGEDPAGFKRAVLDLVAEPVAITGILSKKGDLWMMKTTHHQLLEL